MSNGNDYLEIIGSAPPIDGVRFDPVALVRVVNRLWPLGKNEALAVLQTFVEQAEQGEHGSRQAGRVFPILRVLFVRLDGHPNMPPLAIGAPDVWPRDDADLWPLFPLAVRSQIPFLVVSGYMLGGLPQSPLAHIDYCREQCRLRERPLAPEESPLETAEDLVTSGEWAALTPVDRARELRGMLYLQALRAVSSLYQPSEESLRALYSWNEPKSQVEWRKHREHLSRLAPRWDEAAQQFVRAA